MGNFWEDDIYKKGKSFNKYPYDFIVSFVFQYKPVNKTNDKIKVLEIGCGTGNNLWFAANEGFDVTGIDISETAIEFAKKRFEQDGLSGKFFIGDIHDIELPDDNFDLIIDRSALTCVNFSAARSSIAIINKCCKPGGHFFFNPFSKKHSSYSSAEKLTDGLHTNFKEGLLVGMDSICFYDEHDMNNAFDQNHWKSVEIKHADITDIVSNDRLAEWRAIHQKNG